MNALFQTPLRPDTARKPAALPRHEARYLTNGGCQAEIDLDGTTYVLRITRLGKLILTK